MRTQPPGFRWLVGGFALVAAFAFGVRFFSAGDPGDLILGVLCLAAAGYWLIFDREPAAEDRAGSGGSASDEDSAGMRHDGQALRRHEREGR